MSELLRARAKTHGNYPFAAVFVQDLKHLMRRQSGWEHLCPAMRESLDIMATKIGRVLHGNPAEPDHWNDIAGYATLVSKLLKGEEL